MYRHPYIQWEPSSYVKYSVERSAINKSNNDVFIVYHIYCVADTLGRYWLCVMQPDERSTCSKQIISRGVFDIVFHFTRKCTVPRRLVCLFRLALTTTQRKRWPWSDGLCRTRRFVWYTPSSSTYYLSIDDWVVCGSCRTALLCLFSQIKLLRYSVPTSCVYIQVTPRLPL
jgi:hypothetical protein